MLEIFSSPAPYSSLNRREAEAVVRLGRQLGFTDADIEMELLLNDGDWEQVRALFQWHGVGRVN